MARRAGLRSTLPGHAGPYWPARRARANRLKRHAARSSGPSEPPLPASATIETVDSSYPDDPLTRQHAGRQLRDVESVLLERYRPVLHGAVLELGPGGSRLTEELVHQARAYVGLGPSSAVIGVCRQMYRTGRFLRGELVELEQFDAHAFNAVVACRCVIDALDGERRRLLLRGLHRVLSPAGLLIFSTQNDPTEDAVPRAEEKSSRRGGFLRGLRTRSAQAPMDERELGNELLSGIDGGLSLSHYKISRAGQERQLAELGFRVAECVDLAGHTVPHGDPAAQSPELHYVARPAAPGSRAPQGGLH